MNIRAPLLVAACCLALVACAADPGGSEGGVDSGPRLGDAADAAFRDADDPDVPLLRDCADGETRACGTDVGQCAAGLERCVRGLWSGACEGEVRAAEERCNGLDDDCDEVADEGFGLGRACKYRDERNRQVDGTIACDPETGSATCAARPDCNRDADADGVDVCADCDDEDAHNFPGNAERCDGRDNDCNEVVDDPFVLGEICYAGEGTCRRGGQTVCDPTTFDVGCDAVPAAPEGGERCGDGADVDCDGAVDEGFDVGAPCVVGVGACAREGRRVCGADRLSAACDARPGPAAAERCGDGTDDDCDGAVDEGFVVGEACAVGLGACARAGVTACAPGGEGVVCAGEAGAAVAERCGDGVDDDCDGATDEGFAVGAPCTAGMGACAVAGRLVCSPSGDAAICDARPGAPEPERCGDGTDDDCDGAVDEGFDEGAPCGVGEGECRRAGALVCSADGGAAICDARPGVPAIERCNGRDDDCDGIADEDFAVGSDCAAGVGACAVAGRVLCAADGAAACDAAPRAPRDERCNGADDDCDGATDEDFPGLGEICDDPADADVCARGVRRCDPATGEAVCADDPPSPERCNFRDDDCDGVPDNGFDLFTDVDNCGNCGVVCPQPWGACRDATCWRDYWVSAQVGSDAEGDGSRERPWRTISHATTTVVGPLATINVLPGTYSATMDAAEFERFPIRLRDGVQVLGAGAPDLIVVDADHAGTVFLLQSAPRANNRLAGLTVHRGGRLDGDAPAIRFAAANGAIRDVIVTDAASLSSAAAIEIASGRVTVDGSSFTGSVGSAGAGIVMFIGAGEYALTRSHFRGNRVDRGGVVQARGVGVRVENTTVVGNTGAALSAEFPRARLDVTHCSLVANTGSGVVLFESTTGAFHNNVVAFNGGWGFDEVTAQSDPEAIGTNLIHDNVAGAYHNEGTTTLGVGALGSNFAGDPLFVNAVQAGNLRLRPGSAAIDRADPARTLPADQDDVPRPQGAGPDCGAFEALP